MNEDEENKAKLEYYLEIGAVSFEGVDANGEIIYAINEDAKEIAPELWQSHMNYVDKELLDLYEQGLVEIEYNENLEATIHITPEGYKIAREKGLIEMDFNPDIPND